MFDLTVSQLVAQHVAQFAGYDEQHFFRENNNIKPPESGIWAVMQVDATLSQISSIAVNPLIRSQGLITFRCFDREDNGEYDITVFTDALGTHMALYSSQNLFLEAPATRKIGVTNGWYQVNIIIAYDYFGVKNP